MVGDPGAGSNLSQANALYPYEKVSDRTQPYLQASFEHLLMWADFVAPLKFHPEQVTTFSLRPSYTLARAALESAAQAVWVLSTQQPLECTQRHLRLVRWDMQEHAKSKADPDEKAAIRAREQDLLLRVRHIFVEDSIEAPGGYLEVLQAACKCNQDLDLTVQEAERVWRAASGSAHGMYWPNLELQTLLPGEKYEPGQHRALTLPDPAGIAEVVRTAYSMTRI